MAGTGVLRWAGLASAALLIAPAAAHSAWNQPVGGVSPINESSTQTARQPSLTEIGGVPYVAWSEADGTGAEIRVSRLNAAGDDWEQVVGGASPINFGAGANPNGVEPSLAAIGGVLHVAWAESDGVNNEIRVSRLVGDDWQEIVGGASPINQANNLTGSEPSLAAIGGVPHVAWVEFDGGNSELRVARLNATGTDWEQPWTGVTATFGGINQSLTLSASSPSLTSIGGVPHVAWVEDDGVNQELRVSRANGATWQQFVPGANPINESTTQDASQPSLTTFDGVPHVAWAEDDGQGFEIRVSRLNTVLTSWQQVVGGQNPINYGNDATAGSPSLTAMGGALVVAFREYDGVNGEIRVSRLDGGGGDWEPIVGGSSPINQAINGDAFESSMTSVGGVPYVAWREMDGSGSEIRVSRLEPELGAPVALATDDAALLLSQVRSFGVPYPIVFEFGTSGLLNSRTAVTNTSGFQGTDTVIGSLDGLTPATTYSARASGFDGIRSIFPSGPTQFTTDAQNGPGPAGAQGPAGANGNSGAAGPQGEPAIKLLVAVVNPKLKGRSGKRVTVNYLSTAPGSATLEVLKGRKRVARVTGRARVGRNKIAWNGKQGRKKAKAGRYTLRLTATGGDGQVATDTGTVTLKR